MGLMVRTEELGGSPLVLAAARGEVPDGWYGARPRTPREWAARAREVRKSFPDSGWLDALWPAIEATGAASERLRRAAERGVLVTTGQQPALFGGPVYTWAKALSAVALADAIERECGVPAAALFWAATDDTDFAESARTWVAMPGGAVELTMPRTAADDVMLAMVPLGDMRVLMAQIEAAADSAPFGEALAAVRAAYGSPSASATIGSAYLALLRRLFEPLGVAVLDAAHEAARARAFPILRQALRHATRIDDALHARTGAIAAAGYDPQVALVPGLSLVFEVDSKSGTKRRAPLARAADIAEHATPGTLAPNVVLRPVVERTIIPTVAYVAGPGELAYFAQVSAVATALDAPTPLAVPRWSGTIVEPHIGRLLGQYRLTIDDLAEPHAAERRFARAALPPAIRRALDALSASIDSGTAALGVADQDALLAPAARDGARRALHHRLERLERRYLASVKRTHDAEMRDFATLRGALFPDGQRQERALNFIPTLAREGTGVLDAMRARVDDHAASLVGATTAGASMHDASMHSAPR